MLIARARLESVSPYSQSASIRAEKNKNESHDEFESRVWRERIHADASGRVFIPPTAFKNALSECAQYLSMKIPGKGKATFTKNFLAGIIVSEPLVLDVTREAVQGEWLHLNSDGKKGGGSRVYRCMPVIPSWSGTVVFHIIDEAITREVFAETLKKAGQLIGIGRFRPRNGGFYGRFAVRKIEFSEE